MRRRVWRESMEGEYGGRVWRESMEGEYGGRGEGEDGGRGEGEGRESGEASHNTNKQTKMNTRKKRNEYSHLHTCLIIRSHCSLFVSPSNVLGEGSSEALESFCSFLLPPISPPPLCLPFSLSLLFTLLISYYLFQDEQDYVAPRHCSASFRTASRTSPFVEVAQRGASQR